MYAYRICNVICRETNTQLINAGPTLCLQYTHFLKRCLLAINTTVEKQGRYGEQHILVRYVFDTDLADMSLVRYVTHVPDLRFQNQEFWISTAK